jgi:hypothetical protein
VKTIVATIAAVAALSCAPRQAPRLRAKPSPSVEPRPRAPMTASKTGAVHAPSTAASASGAALPLPLTPAPPGTDPEKVTIAASICAAAYLGHDVGCRSHPPFVRPEQQPDGKIVRHEGDPLMFCSIARVYHGSFTKPGAKQAVLAFDQCKESEDAEWDAGFPGSAVLVEQRGARWKAVAYEPDVNMGLCLRDRRADGRDVLLCRSNFGAPPTGQVSYVFLLDFAWPATQKGQRAVSLVELFSDNMSCGFAADGLPSGITSLEIAGMALADLNHDGTPDLAVQVRRAHRAPSPKLEAALHALCNRPRPGDPSALVPRAKPDILSLVSRGETFVPTAATRKTIERWTAESPDDFNGLSGAAPPLAGD